MDALLASDLGRMSWAFNSPGAVALVAFDFDLTIAVAMVVARVAIVWFPTVTLCVALFAEYTKHDVQTVLMLIPL